MKKLLIILSSAAIVLVIALFFFLFAVLGYGQVSFAYENKTTSLVNELHDAEALKNQGFVVNVPDFYNGHPTFGRSIDLLFDEMNGLCLHYAFEISSEYNNYAKLAYTVDIVPNSTLTIHFVGFGYPDSDVTANPVPLEKTFIFSIQDASVENPPKLIGGDIEFAAEYGIGA